MMVKNVFEINRLERAFDNSMMFLVISVCVCVGATNRQNDGPIE